MEKIELGIKQRVRVLEMFLNDIYGPQHVLADRVVPRKLITTSEHFHRAAIPATHLVAIYFQFYVPFTVVNQIIGFS